MLFYSVPRYKPKGGDLKIPNKISDVDVQPDRLDNLIINLFKIK